MVFTFFFKAQGDCGQTAGIPTKCCSPADCDLKPTKDHLRVLQDYFGHMSFRPMQWRIISAALQVLSL